MNEEALADLEVFFDHEILKNERRLSKRLIKANTVEEVGYLCQCGNCWRWFGNRIIITCQKGHNTCEKCIARDGQRMVCPVDDCRLIPNFQNSSLFAMIPFIFENMYKPKNTKDEYFNVVLNEDVLNLTRNLIKCYRCQVSVFSHGTSYFCHNGHTLCLNCPQCSCGKTKLSIRSEPLENVRFEKFCAFINTLEPPEYSYQCRYQGCEVELPKNVLKEHVIRDHRYHPVDFTTITSTKKQSRIYRTHINYEARSRYTSALTSPKGDFLFYDVVIDDNYDIMFNVKPLCLQENTHYGLLQKVPCIFRLRRGNKFGNILYMVKIMILTLQKDDRWIDVYNNIIRFIDMNLPQQEPTELCLEIILGDDRDVDYNEFKSPNLDTAYQPIYYV